VPSGGDLVECLYAAVLGRAPDAGGRAYVEGRLAAGESVHKLARKLMVTSEGRRVQFGRIYDRLLGRAPTADEIAAGVAEIGDRRTEPWIAAQIAGSAEYVERASR
jgi:hypothetical protein